MADQAKIDGLPAPVVQESTRVPEALEPDENPYDNSDADSAFGSDGESSTQSLASSILNYEYENGRRYHAYCAGAYPLPNDEKEQERMDMQHHIYLLLLRGELHRAPLQSPVGNVLDIGTGTGIWAMDFADLYPECNVIATDLSAIQPSWIPPNVQFRIDDAEQEWDFRHKFDYIHARSMGGSIGNWERLLKQSYDNLNPGGWIEITDFETWATTDDNSLPETSPYHEYQVQLNLAAEKFGKVMNVSPRFEEFVRNAGFTSVTEEKRKTPLSPWAKDKRMKALGQYMNIQMMESIEPYSLALFTRVLRWDNAKIQALLAGVREDLRNLNYHMYSVVHTVYGQKPPAQEKPEKAEATS
ncbi:hypothetical protein McanMca71_003352 [Microsporum canis]